MNTLTIKEVTNIGDLKITTETINQNKHNGFFHKLFCGIVRHTSETILCNPPITTEKDYYKCGYVIKKRFEEIKN